MLLAAGCEGGLFYWMPNFMQDVHGATPTVAGLTLTAFSLAMVAGRLGAGAATRVVPQRRLLVWLAVGGLLTSAGLVVAQGVVLSIALCALAGLFGAAFWPGILSLAAARISVGSATLYAMLSVSGIAGFGLMPFVIGGVGQWLGLRAGIAAVPVGFGATAVVLALALRPARGSAEPEAPR
jgi:fucose permease